MAIFTWFAATFKQYPEIAIFLTLALGYYFGKFTFKGLGLGSVTATLLAGVLIGQIGSPSHSLSRRQCSYCFCSPSATGSGHSSSAVSPRMEFRKPFSPWSSAYSVWRSLS